MSASGWVILQLHRFLRRGVEKRQTNKRTNKHINSAEKPTHATTVGVGNQPTLFSKRQRITLRLLYAIAIPSVVCLSVCLSSVTLVHPTQAVELFGNLFSPYDSPGTLLFWCQKSLVGDAHFPLKFTFKVTHPLSNSAISTNIGS